MPHGNERRISPAKRWLRQAWQAEARVHALLERRERYQDMATRATRPTDSLHVTGGPAEGNLAELVVAIADMNREITLQVKELAAIVAQREAAIATLPDERQRAVLALRYLDGHGWEKIALELHFDVRTVYRFHEKGLEEMEKLEACQQMSVPPVL